MPEYIGSSGMFGGMWVGGGGTPTERTARQIERHLDRDDDAPLFERVQRRDDPDDAKCRRMLLAVKQRTVNRFHCRLLGSPDAVHIYANAHFSPVTQPYLPGETVGLSPLYKVVGVTGPDCAKDHEVRTPLVHHFPSTKLVRDPDGREHWELARPMLDAEGKPVLNVNGRPKFWPDQKPEPITISLWAPIPHGVVSDPESALNGQPWHGLAIILHDHKMIRGWFDDIDEWAAENRVLVATCGPTAENPRRGGLDLPTLQDYLAENGWSPDIEDPPEPEPHERDLPA